jgi:hypothetical protein
MNPQDLQAYFNSDPAFFAEYERNRLGSNGTDRRTPAQWMEGYLTENPQEQGKFYSFLSGSQATPDLPANQLNALIAAADAGDQNAIAQLRAAGYEQVADTEVLPVEQGILQTILPNLTSDIEGDAARRALVATLTGQATDDYNLARNALSPEENARRLAEEYAMADTTAGRLSDSAATSAAQQLAALQSSITAMQQNLTGANAEKAAALQAQIAAFTANLDAYDATQKAALAQQIADNQANLERSIAAQQQALVQEVNALRGAADANSVARRAALQAEIDGLTAAQAPMAKARLDSANALATAVNLGLETTRDQLTADRARQGYLGSSTFSDAALGRAAIGARQNAAGVLGAAREANAGDLRSIQTRGATEGRLLADELANNYLSLAGREATGTRSLADILAEGTRGIADTGAAGRAGIANATGLSRQNIGNAGATQSYQDRVVGANDLQALLDTLARGNLGIRGTLAQEQQQARDSGTMARQGYFDNAYTRGQGAILSRPGLSSNLASTLAGLENYGSAGTNRALNTLSWFDTRGQAAPTIGTTPAVVDNSGADIAGLGAGLLGTALNIGQSNNWWQNNGAGSKTTYADYLKNNPYSSAALG